MIEPELARRSRKEHFINLLTQVEFASPSEIRGIARQLEWDGDPTKTWHDLREPLTELQIRAEANRCLKCGATVVDENRCIGCGLCTTRCEFDAIRLERDHPEASVMYTAEEGMKHILAYAAKRELKILRNEGKAKLKATKIGKAIMK